jgi:PKD repeat protein
LEVAFDAFTSTDPDGSIVSYAWDFGDGQQGTGVTPTHTYTSEGTYTVTLTVTDNDGASRAASHEIAVVTEILPPDPVTVAPPIDPTVATTVFAAAEFLYTGAHPIQTGVAEGTLEPQRVAVLRGQVRDRDGNPLSGVTITILDYSEYGQTLSRRDGMFDLVVNGGGYLTVNYHRDHYLPAERQINVPWQDYALLPEVALVKMDSSVTTVDLATPGMKVARGSEVSDADGTRQAALLIPQGVSAELMLPDGSTASITELHIRTTEYSVGANGQRAMPAELPPTSAYTYAVEIAADKAVAKVAGKDVVFSQPVPFYVEDFIGFPVGSAVPTGYYDGQHGRWVASENGRVIKIIGVAGGLAEVDTDGDDVADDVASLGAMGITEAEREQLAGLYSPGQTLWRVPLPHLSTWDCNWPYGPPEGADRPRRPRPNGDDRVDDPCTQVESSLIECQNQILGERVPIVGTPFTLNYRSDRVPGRKVARTLDVSLSGDTLPAGLKRIELIIEVAGRRFVEQFEPETHLSYRFSWDGLDNEGRLLQGQQQARVRIGYAYPAVYYSTSSDRARAFGRAGVFRGSGGGGGGGVVVGARRSSSPPPEVVLWQIWDAYVGTWNGALGLGLGGWNLDVHHFYDRRGRVLYLGSGERRSARGLFPVVETVAGVGDIPVNTLDAIGDEGPAIEAILTNPTGIAVGRDGSLSDLPRSA